MINLTKKFGYKAITIFMVVIMLVGMMSATFVVSAVEPADETVSTTDGTETGTEDSLVTDDTATGNEDGLVTGDTTTGTEDGLVTDGTETETDDTTDNGFELPNIDEIPDPEPDKTKPAIVPVKFTGNTLYPVDVQNVSIQIIEKRGLKSVKIFLNDKEVPYVVEADTYTFVIPSDSSEQNVRVEAVDTSGNKASIKIENIIVSSDFFVRFTNDTTFMITSIIVAVVIILVVIGIVILIKKRIKYMKGV